MMSLFSFALSLWAALVSLHVHMMFRVCKASMTTHACHTRRLSALQLAHLIEAVCIHIATSQVSQGSVPACA